MPLLSRKSTAYPAYLDSQQGVTLFIVLLALLVVVAGVGYVSYRAVMQAQPTATTAADEQLNVTPTEFVGQSAADGQAPSTSSSGSTGSSSSSGSSSTTGTTTSTSGSTTTSSSSSSSSNTPVTDSGISGTVTLAVGCKPPAECADIIKPYQATIVVESVTGAALTSITSDTKGDFSVVLAPGTYKLVPDAYASGKITAATQTVTVTAHHFATASIAYKETL